MLWYIVVKYVGLFVLAGLLGVSMLRIEMWQPNKRKQLELRTVDWLAYFYKSGCFGLMAAFIASQYLFKQQMSLEMYAVFVVVGAVVGEKMVPFFLKSVTNVVRRDAELYNKDVEEKWNLAIQELIKKIQDNIENDK